MTWSAQVTRPDGTNPTTREGSAYSDYNACQSCQHTSFCNIGKMAHTIGPILTSVDVGSDGHMASGTALLKCNGYQLKE
ncbi:hypothetical protein [Geoanaerobacter pelophilus]|uniref:hypothetical protein n=1 Tax=Geoanaerobacter pelophilus TaxID=60036 RepID=UPI001BDB63FC|nr:hypothetical protein [Geoanaerobacter pelophilus]